MEPHPETVRTPALTLLPLVTLLAGLALTWLFSLPAREPAAEQARELSVAHHQALYSHVSGRADYLLAETGRLRTRLARPEARQDQEAARFLAAHPGVTGIEYLISVNDPQRAMVEQQLSREAGQFIRFGHWRQGAAEPQPHYLIVRKAWFRPGSSDPSVSLGLVADSVPHWQPALYRALGEEQIAATTLTSIQRNGAEQQAMRLFVPVTDDQLLSLVIEPEFWLSGMLDPLHDDRWQLAIHDASQHARHPLFSLPALGVMAEEEAIRTGLPVADRQWMLTTTPSRTWLDSVVRQAVRPLWLLGGLLSLAATALCLWLVFQLGRSRQQQSQAQQAAQISQRQLANLKVEKAVLHQSLADSDERSRDLIELYGGSIGELDDHYRLGYLSPGTARLLDRPVPEMLGQPLADLVTREHQSRLNDTLVAARRESGIQRVDLELATGGQPVPVTLRVKALKHPVSGCTGYRVSILPR